MMVNLVENSEGYRRFGFLFQGEESVAKIIWEIKVWFFSVMGKELLDKSEETPPRSSLSIPHAPWYRQTHENGPWLPLSLEGNHPPAPPSQGEGEGGGDLTFSG